MRRGAVWFLSVFALCSTPSTVFADVAFPARLDVAESEPGIYDVSFTLPIIEGRKLRAEPLLPPTCTEMEERQAGLSAGGLTTTWSVQCEPASLAGEAILVQGLLGTQTDLAFTFTTLDGRSYSRILRPSRPGFLVPQPPSVVGLALSAALQGARSTLRHPGLWVLFCVVALTGSRFRELGVAAVVFALGYFVALWLESQVWLEVAPGTRGSHTVGLGDPARPAPRRRRRMARLAAPVVALHPASGAALWRDTTGNALVRGPLHNRATPRTAAFCGGCRSSGPVDGFGGSAARGRPRCGS